MKTVVYNLVGKVALLCALLFLFQSLPAQFATDSLLNGDSLCVEVMELKKQLADSHTDLHFYTPDSILEEGFLALENRVADGLSLKDYGVAVSEYIGLIRDSHTYLNYGAFMSPHSKDDGLYLDLKVRSLSADAEKVDGLYVTESAYEIPRGSRLLLINGQNADSVWSEISRTSIMEGNSKVGKQRISDAIFTTMLPAFVAIEEENELVFMKPDSTTASKVSISGKTSAEMKTRKQRLAKKAGENSPYDLYQLYDNKGVAVLRIGSFGQGGTGAFNHFIDRSFRRVKKLGYDTLVLDLRYNTGGSADRMQYLLDHVSADSGRVPANIIAKGSETARLLHLSRGNAFSRFLIKNFFKNNEEVKHYLRMASLEVGDVDTLDYITPTKTNRKNLFNGKCYLLINGMSGSASVSFASVFQERAIGEIAGEPCLGPTGGTWGNPQRYTLPYSNLPLILSTIRFNARPNHSHDPTPVQVDFRAKYTPKNLAKDEDLELEWIIDQR